MAAKYCDHGAYALTGAFTASVNANGTTLTVTAVSSGYITLGMEIVGLSEVNFPWPVQVTAFGTGAGGTGTYTLSYANRSTAVSATALTGRGGQPPNGAFWGVPQDGDGLAKDPSTASAVAQIVFTGTPTGTISVCGVTVSPTWGATADSAANGLATAINAATSAVTAGGFSLSPQLRNAVWARGPASGAPSGTCQIMTRAGSALFNGQTAIAHTLTNVNAGASSLAFSGGVSGCWGWLFNPAKLWPSALAEMSYGLLTANTAYAGSVIPGDTVHIRSGKVINYFAWSNGGQTDILMPSYGTVAEPVTFKVDDSTVWADGAEPVLELRQTTTMPHTIYLPNMAGGQASLVARKYSDTKYGLTWSAYGTQVSAGVLSLKQSNTLLTRGVDIYCGAGGGAVTILKNTTVAHGGGSCNVFEDSRIRQQSQLSAPWFSPSATLRTELRWRGVIFDCGQPANPSPAVLDLLSTAYSPVVASFDGCRFVNFVVGSVLATATTTSNTRIGTVQFRNTDFGNVTKLGPYMTGAVPNNSTPGTRSIGWGSASTSQLGNRDFFIDTPAGWCAWVSTRAFPTLNARLHDGITPWSLQVIPTTVAGNVSPFTPFESPRLAKINSLPTGVRTLTLNFGIEQSLAWGRRDVSLMVEYEGEDGVMRSIDTFDPDNAALDVSTATWTNADGPQFTYSESGVLYFNKKSLSITTPTTIKTGTEIGCYVRIHSSVSDTTKQLFVDPELVVT